jgi:predicted nucleic acid-binding protein
MIYIDTSSLLKLVIPDEHSVAVELAVAKEGVILVSTLTDLEAGVQVRGLLLGGKLPAKRVRRIEEDLADILRKQPFTVRHLAGSVFSSAIAQHQKSGVHCRSLDRLHLAAMQELGIKRLMTHDLRQAEAAKELGYVVDSPGL